MCLHMPFELAGLGTGVITQMTLIGPLSCVTASVDDEVALEFEDLSAELTGFGFPGGLVLTLCVWRAGRAVSPLRGGWLWCKGEK